MRIRICGWACKYMRDESYQMSKAGIVAGL